MHTRKQLRQQFLAYRRSLTADFIQTTEKIIAQQVLTIIKQNNYQQIALYSAIRNEVGTQLLIQQLLALDYHVYLPVVDKNGSLELTFVRYHTNTITQTGSFGINEPIITTEDILPIQQLDFICIPLVAFDQAKNRLGMGKGYYDYTLRNSKDLKLVTCGLAYAKQQTTELLPTETWDIPLDMIVTEKNTLI